MFIRSRHAASAIPRQRDMDESHQDHRTAYRVRYPLGYPAQRIPRVVVEPGRKVELDDWSEKGLRIRYPQPRTAVVGDPITLTITLPDEEPLAAEGKIVWMDDEFAAIQLDSHTLPWRILLNEQRAIARWRTRLIEVRENTEPHTR
jgi:hypothetical protein